MSGKRESHSSQNSRAARARSATAEIPRALRPARRRSGGLLAQGVSAQPDEGAFRGGSGKLPVRSVSAVAPAMAGSTKVSCGNQNCPPFAPEASFARTPSGKARGALTSGLHT